MNIDDPRLTAFALDELDEPEKSAIASEVATSPEAQRAVDEIREFALALKNQFASEFDRKTDPSRNLSDIRDDPWFWSIGRPLAIAAVIAIFSILSAVIITTRSRHDSARAVPSTEYTLVEGEQNPPNENLPKLIGPEEIPNPWKSDVIRGVDHVVIGELPVADSQEHELTIIETIRDEYRIRHLKERLSVSKLARKNPSEQLGRAYTLMFVDRNGQIVAGANFYSAGNLGFVLQPLKNAYERNGKYFLGGDTPLPADWKNDVDYRSYVIRFPDWNECVGYAPRA